MRFAYHYRRSFPKQLELLTALESGTAGCDEIVPIQGFDGVNEDCHGLILYGIGGESRSIFDAYRCARKLLIFFDKGYTKDTGKVRKHLRVAVGDSQPTRYLMSLNAPSDRLERLNLELRPFRGHLGEYILFDGASKKYCLWKGFGNYRRWGSGIIKKIKQYSSRPIIYRPRPTGMPDMPIAGSELSILPLIEDFDRAFLVISYGGNLGIDAVIAGLPHFSIGDSAARPISEIDWSNLDNPRQWTRRERWQWLCNLAYCQWTLDEIRSGEAWAHIRRLITG